MKKLVLFIFLLPLQAIGQNKIQPVIDMHLHANDYGQFGVPNPNTGKVTVHNKDEFFKMMFEVMEKNNVVIGAVSFVQGPEHANEVLKAWERKGGDRILKGLYGSKEYPAVDTLRKWLTTGRYDFLGELTFQYRGLSPSDTSFFKYYELAEELDIPIGIHTGTSAPRTPYNCCPDFRLSLGNPYLLEDLLVKFPKLRVWAMHAGNQYFNEMCTMMNMYPQLYVDISPNSWIEVGNVAGNLERFLKRAMEQKVLNRVMYGTDNFTFPEAIEMGIRKIRSLDYLTEQEKADILYNNAAKFLRLSESEIARHHGR